MEKTNVNPPDAHPAFTWLRENSDLKGANIPWNFAKFLLDKDGRVVAYYTPDYAPKFTAVDINYMLTNPDNRKNPNPYKEEL